MASDPNNLLRAVPRLRDCAEGHEGSGPAGKPEAFRKSGRQSRTHHWREVLLWTAAHGRASLPVSPVVIDGLGRRERLPSIRPKLVNRSPISWL